MCEGSETNTARYGTVRYIYTSRSCGQRPVWFISGPGIIPSSRSKTKVLKNHIGPARHNTTRRQIGAKQDLNQIQARSSVDRIKPKFDLMSRIIWTGPFEKFTRVTMLLPLTGQQYSEKVAENCLAHWKAAGVYTEAEGAAVDKFKEAFKAETFPPGSSILFTHSPSGSLTVK